ncbi:MAG: hypothetical protein K6V97_09075 [Actinomycetia bacterium]|nr:hypothetical protein [Actinomycetes bacterium]
MGTRRPGWAIGGLSVLSVLLAGCGTPAPSAPPGRAGAVLPFRVVAQRTADLARDPVMRPAAFAALAVTADGWVAAVPASSGTVIAGSPDAGATWTRLADLSDTVTALAFPTPSVGYALARPPAGGPPENHTLLRTADGGRTWTPVFRGAVVQVQFLSANQGYALALGSPAPALLATRDGGRSWTAVGVLPATNGVVDARMAWSDPRVGWVLLASEPGAGSQAKVLYRTVDGGRTWTLAAASGPMAGMTTARPSGAGTLPMGGYVSGLAVFDARDARIALARGGAWATADGGRTWTPVWTATFPPDVRDITDLVMPTPTDGVALTGRGAIWITSDGTTWRRRYPPDRRIAALAAGPQGLAMLTTGGQVETRASGRWTVRGSVPTGAFGVTWAGRGVLALTPTALVRPGRPGRFLPLPRGWRLLAASFSSSRDGVATVLPSGDPRGPALAVTADGGGHWRLLATPFRPAALAALGPGRWWVAGGVPAAGPLPPKPKPPPLRWNLYVTRDGGRSWTTVATEQGLIEGLDMVSPQNGWFWTGTTLYRTTDGGRTWTALTLTDALASGTFAFASATVGWTAGAWGYPLYRTVDGGLAWHAVATP